MARKSAIVIGAGIVGLAVAHALQRKNFQVQVFERGQKATGASIRNFGMVWPIGQPSGHLYERAIRSRNQWKWFGDQGVCWNDNVGSLQVACYDDEWQVLQELYDQFKGERPVELWSPEAIALRNTAVSPGRVLGGLFCSDEIIVDPPKAIGAVAAYLEVSAGIEFHWGKCVHAIADGKAFCGKQSFSADIIFVCSGADFETLYPERFATYQLTKCKLQMMRLVGQPNNRRIGPALCGGLSLIHYKSFHAAPSLPALRERYRTQMADYLEAGIHVMVSQNERGELVVGDSHEYNPSPDPFDRKDINDKILAYLKGFAEFQDWSVLETWNGVYGKLANGETELFESPEPGVYLLTALGGAGMTLSFGLAEEVVSKL